MINSMKESTQKIVDKVEETTQPIMSPVYKATRSVLLASIGAVALTKDEIDALVNRLVEKGEISEKEGRKLVDEWVVRSKETRQEITDKMSETVSKKVEAPANKTTKLVNQAEEAFTQQIQSILNAMNIPSKSDIEELTQKIDTLAQKVRQLDQKLSAEAKSTQAQKATKKAA